MQAFSAITNNSIIPRQPAQSDEILSCFLCIFLVLSRQKKPRPWSDCTAPPAGLGLYCSGMLTCSFFSAFPSSDDCFLGQLLLLVLYLSNILDRIAKWMGDLQFYILNKVFQSFQDDGRMIVKGCVQCNGRITRYNLCSATI